MYINLICDYRLRPEYRRLVGRGERVVHLSADAEFGNVVMDVGAFARDLGKRPDPVSLDLCEIAAYVYLGDKAVARGRYEKWTRNLSYLVPVRNPDLWESVRETLTDTVGTLSGDNVRFNFVPRRDGDGTPEPRPAHDERAFAESDCACLFSGGLDSFAGAAHLIREGRRPLFAGHYSNHALKGLQSSLMAGIRAEFGEDFRHFQYRVAPRRNPRAPHAYARRESSHRARSFLFTSFAAAAAALHGLSEVFICENGVMSLNVPISDARKGSRSTRHAHPLYLSHFNRLIDSLYGRRFSVRNPFSFWTKGEEARLLGSTNLYPMIKETVTCWGYPNQTARYPHTNHCGYCLPCIVRRVSLTAAGMEGFDDRYLVDVFGPSEGLTEAQLRNVEDLAYFCRSFATLSKTELLYRYPELVMIEAGEGDPSDDRLGKIISVYRKFADEFAAVAASRDIPGPAAGALPEARAFAETF